MNSRVAKSMIELVLWFGKPLTARRRAAFAAEWKQLAADAARYRWLKTRINWSDGEMGMSTARTAPLIMYKTRTWAHQDMRPAADRPASEHIDQYIDSCLTHSANLNGDPK